MRGAYEGCPCGSAYAGSPGDAHAGARTRSYAGRLLLSSGNANYSPPNPLGSLLHTVMERVKGTAVFGLASWDCVCRVCSPREMIKKVLECGKKYTRLVKL